MIELSLMEFSLTKGQLKVISSVLANLAASWLASIVVLPGIFGVKSTLELVILLTFSPLFATVAMYSAGKIEDKLL